MLSKLRACNIHEIFRTLRIAILPCSRRDVISWSLLIGCDKHTPKHDNFLRIDANSEHSEHSTVNRNTLTIARIGKKTQLIGQEKLESDYLARNIGRIGTRITYRPPFCWKNGGVAEVWQRLAPASTYLWHPFFCFSCFNCSRYVYLLLWSNKIVSELTLCLLGDDILQKHDRIVCVFNANMSFILSKF